MTVQKGRLPDWLEVNAWREIFARIFEGVNTQFNITPDWLINPATKRRLKLDMVYTNLGIAVRFEGLRGKQQRRRLSLEEEEQLRTRQDARVDVCQEHGIQLIVVNTSTDKPRDIFQNIDTALGRANRNVTDEKIGQMLKACRLTASKFSRKITKPADLKIYAELWQDRLYQVPEASNDSNGGDEPIDLVVGMEVEHEKFGPGVVVSISPNQDDTFVTIDFITAGQKTLAASLIGGKVSPR
ncbi:MAG: hypothetical protein KDJ65_33545 [Anaerolineae bacterium]|nr:hypothetical protein [Anaerolineae bacterium]